MDAKYLAEIKTREEAATVGPWDDKVTAVYKANTAIKICGDFHRFAADAFFIAQARTDIPALIAEVERLTEFVHTQFETIRQQGRELNRRDGIIKQQDQQIATLEKASEIMQHDLSNPWTPMGRYIQMAQTQLTHESTHECDKSAFTVDLVHHDGTTWQAQEQEGRT